MKDIFPPAVPSGLEAVAVPDDKTIDLSWQPGSDNDLAGYVVYRSIAENSHPVWTRISGPEPLTAPAFRDTTAQPGQLYRYAVTAVDQGGHESARSPEAHEALSKP
jgi:fibronectin type 3 domain-containing protein